jgi:hypothetical protein
MAAIMLVYDGVTERWKEAEREVTRGRWSIAGGLLVVAGGF